MGAVNPTAFLPSVLSHFTLCPDGIWWSGYFRCHRPFHPNIVCFSNDIIIISDNLRFVKTFCKFEEASV